MAACMAPCGRLTRSWIEAFYVIGSIYRSGRVGIKQKAVGSTRTGSVALAIGPFCLGSAELFLYAAACILRNRSWAAELQTNSAAGFGCMKGLRRNTQREE
jgi:hypothetical protein